MYSILLLSAPWMAVAMVAEPEAPVTATVAYTYFTPAFSPPPLRLGDECFIPAAQASRLGWACEVVDGHAVVEAEGRKVETFVRELSGTRYLPVRSVVASLGGESEWGAQTNLKVYSKITAIRAEETGLEVTATLPFKCSVFAVDKPDRIVVDITGARVPEGFAESVGGPARFSQFSPDTVRVVVQLDAAPKLSPTGRAGGRTISVAWSNARSVPLTTGAADTTPKPQPTTVPTGAIRAAKPIIERDVAKDTLLRIPLSAMPTKTVSVKRDKEGVYWISLPGIYKAEGADEAVKAQVIHQASYVDTATGTSLRMELKRPMGVRLSTAGADVLVRIVEPKNGFGTIASKTIVVDAGHGGTDSGARYGSGSQVVNEKDVTLPIARLVAEQLSAAGSTVLMTRDDDTFIPLPNRSQVANESSADFFVSIHINSNSVDNSRSGTYTYYHFDDPDCRLLAECIQSEVAKVTGLPDNGVASDRTVAKTKGFAVLRGSEMPAVLVEVAYINNAKDRALMMSDAFRQKVADAIVRGIRKYIGDGQD
jgi:N-acetylmuramoyl-L-alanine amidase